MIREGSVLLWPIEKEIDDWPMIYCWTSANSAIQEQKSNERCKHKRVLIAKLRRIEQRKIYDAWISIFTVAAKAWIAENA